MQVGNMRVKFDWQSYMPAAPLCPAACTVSLDAASCESEPSESSLNQEDQQVARPGERKSNVIKKNQEWGQ